jgi:hypothetical protein
MNKAYYAFSGCKGIENPANNHTLILRNLLLGYQGSAFSCIFKNN